MAIMDDDELLMLLLCHIEEVPANKYKRIPEIQIQVQIQQIMKMQMLIHDEDNDDKDEKRTWKPLFEEKKTRFALKENR